MESFIELWQILGLIFFSAIKFFLAPAACVLLGHSFIVSFLISAVGGCIGFIAFYKGGLWIRKKYFKFFPPKEDKAIFTKKNKLIVKVKHTYGFWGLAVITPFILGMPIGGILAAIYYPQNSKVIPFFCGMTIFAALLLSAISIYIKEF